MEEKSDRPDTAHAIAYLDLQGYCLGRIGLGVCWLQDSIRGDDALIVDESYEFFHDRLSSDKKIGCGAIRWE